MFLHQPHRRWVSIAVLVVLGSIVLSCAPAPEPTPTPEPTSTPEPVTAPRMPAAPPVKNEESWLILSNLPENATQLEKGAEIWRLVCQDCHGDKGQGLTQDWIAQWDPSDQNCWQAKCHATNHPPEGFILPRYVPPLVGETALARFATASDLHAYMRDKMPWHTPGSLQDGEYWELTAHVLDMNGIGPLPTDLDAEQATGILLR